MTNEMLVMWYLGIGFVGGVVAANYFVAQKRSFAAFEVASIIVSFTLCWALLLVIGVANALCWLLTIPGRRWRR